MSACDLVIALGKNWRRRPFGLSIESKLVALAAAELWRRGDAAAILFSGGQTAGPARPSEAAAMRDYVLRHDRRIPAEVISLEERSIDTAGNAAEVRAILGADPGRIALLTTAAHLPAARTIFTAHGIPIAVTLPAEDILRLRSSRHAAWARKYAVSPARLKAWATELFRRPLLRLDPSGMLLRPLTQVLRR